MCKDKEQSQKIQRLEKALSKVKENSQQLERMDEDVSTFKEHVFKIKEQLQPREGYPLLLDANSDLAMQPQKQEGRPFDIPVSRIK